MRKKALVVLAATAIAFGISGCKAEPIDNSQYDVVDGYDYSGMRDNDKYFSAVDEKQNIDRGVYKDGIKDDVMSNAVPVYPEETEDSATQETERYRIVGDLWSDDPSLQGNKESSSSSSGNSSSSNKSSNSSSSSSNKSTTETTAAAGPTHGTGNTSSINTSDSSSNSSSESSSSGSANSSADNPEKRKNPASMTINGTKYNVYITVEGYYRGSSALRKLNTYNSKHAIEYNLDTIRKGYEPVIVQFTVSAGENIPSANNTLIPEMRVKNGSGQTMSDLPIRVDVLRLGNYKDDSASTKSWDAVFQVPEDEDGFQVIFGSSNGNTYKFKSSQLADKED